jgi:hypothetical protein
LHNNKWKNSFHLVESSGTGKVVPNANDYWYCSLLYCTPHMMNLHITHQMCYSSASNYNYVYMYAYNFHLAHHLVRVSEKRRLFYSVNIVPGGKLESMKRKPSINNNKRSLRIYIQKRKNNWLPKTTRIQVGQGCRRTVCLATT